MSGTRGHFATSAPPGPAGGPESLSMIPGMTSRNDARLGGDRVTPRVPRVLAAAAAVVLAALVSTNCSGSHGSRVTVHRYPMDLDAGVNLSGITVGPDRRSLWFTEYSSNGCLDRFVIADHNVRRFCRGLSPNRTPDGIVTGPDGNIWFTEFTADRIGRITPAGVVTEFWQGLHPNSNPSDITVGPDGALWFTEPLADRIGRISPRRPYAVTEFGGLRPGANPDAIVVGPDGNLWFTGLLGDEIGRIDPRPPYTVTEFRRGIHDGAEPVKLTAGPLGRLWFTELSGDRVGTASTDPPGRVIEFPLAHGSHPHGIVDGSDGGVWFTESGRGVVGRMSPDGRLHEYVVDGPATELDNILLSANGDLWVTDSRSNQVIELAF